MAAAGSPGLDIPHSQVVAYTATAAPITNVIGQSEVMLCATSACWIQFGPTPVAVKATAASFLLPAFTLLRCKCKPTDKVSAVQDTAGGNLSVAPIA